MTFNALQQKIRLEKAERLCEVMTNSGIAGVFDGGWQFRVYDYKARGVWLAPFITGVNPDKWVGHSWKMYQGTFNFSPLKMRLEVAIRNQELILGYGFGCVHNPPVNAVARINKTELPSSAPCFDYLRELEVLERPVRWLNRLRAHMCNIGCIHIH
ncbi:TPA: hypothetical protein QIF36_002358 [Enterobacter kobei]|nr:hypothetical protein [Enterobacter kobei]